jgi:hypothetical protein
MVYFPTLPYGSENWMMVTKHENRITGAEVKYLGKCTGKQEETELDVAKLEEY